MSHLTIVLIGLAIGLAWCVGGAALSFLLGWLVAKNEETTRRTLR